MDRFLRRLCLQLQAQTTWVSRKTAPENKISTIPIQMLKEGKVCMFAGGRTYFHSAANKLVTTTSLNSRINRSVKTVGQYLSD